MTISEDLFGKREIYPDKIKSLIDEMNKLAEKQKFEEANNIKSKIFNELEHTQKTNFPFNIINIKDVDALIKSEMIRLDMFNFKCSDWLNLVMNVYKRKNEIQGMSYSDIEKQRKIVAEEMKNLGITIPCKWKGKKPNRRFLDIAYEVNPSLVYSELMRRERVKLYKGIKKSKVDEIKEVKKTIKKIQDDIINHNDNL